MESGGGTNIWCPKCDAIRECKVIWYDNASKGNFVDDEFPDLHWRERPRECNHCGYQFNTYEIEYSAISELIELRKLINEMKNKIIGQQKYPTKTLKAFKFLKSK